MSPPLLALEDLRVSILGERGSLDVVDGISLSIERDEALCIVGESGSGKSVTMLSVMRLMDERVVSYGGRVMLEGTDLLALSAPAMRRIRGEKIAMIFQDPMTALNPVYRVGWQITEQIQAHTSVTAAAARGQALEALRAVGIPDPERRIDDFPHQLSGGMRQRVMIALALSCEPQILIADEPTTALDVTVQAQILQLIADARAERGMAVVLVTHDMGVVADIADRVVVLYGGRVMEEGSVRDIFEDARHPYTQGLLASIPRLDQPKPRRLPSIAGAPASAGQVGKGCAFAPRCPHRIDPCAKQPGLTTVTATATAPPAHRVACHLVGPGAPAGASSSATTGTSP